MSESKLVDMDQYYGQIRTKELEIPVDQKPVAKNSGYPKKDVDKKISKYGLKKEAKDDTNKIEQPTRKYIVAQISSFTNFIKRSVGLENSDNARVAELWAYIGYYGKKMTGKQARRIRDFINNVMMEE